jgi:hypothetical protein
MFSVINGHFYGVKNSLIVLTSGGNSGLLAM